MNIPCDSTTPAFIQMMQWIINPLAILERSQKRYGDVFSLPIEEKFKPLIFVSHPDAVREVLKLDPPDEPNKFLEPTLGRYSVFTLNGNAHHRQR